MAVIKLVENYAINYLRTQVRDSLMYHGEEAILLSLFHPEIDKHVGKCPRCSWDAYSDGENMCPVCYGTNLYDDKTQTGGVKDARRAWCVFSDHVISEQYGQRGVMAPDQREVQTEPFPMLVEHDVIARVRRWDPTTHTALTEPEFYIVDAVTRNSLRTGNRFGQTWEDVIGQKAQCTWLPPNSSGIQLYPVKDVAFPEFKITGTPSPTVVAEPDTKVIYVPLPEPAGAPGTGTVAGGALDWNPVFTFTQPVPITPWVISHTLGHLPEVTVVVGGEEVDADVEYPNANTVVIVFAQPQAGTAELV